MNKLANLLSCSRDERLLTHMGVHPHPLSTTYGVPGQLQESRPLEPLSDHLRPQLCRPIPDTPGFIGQKRTMVRI